MNALFWKRSTQRRREQPIGYEATVFGTTSQESGKSELEAHWSSASPLYRRSENGERLDGRGERAGAGSDGDAPAVRVEVRDEAASDEAVSAEDECVRHGLDGTRTNEEAARWAASSCVVAGMPRVLAGG